jgi:hypothetical protein
MTGSRISLVSDFIQLLNISPHQQVLPAKANQLLEVFMRLFAAITISLFGWMLLALNLVLHPERQQASHAYWIAFISERDGQPDVYRMLADGSHLERVTYNPAAESELAWGSDARSLSFRARIEQKTSFHQLDLASGQLATTGYRTNQVWLPNLSPDGEWLVMHANLGRDMDIYRRRWGTHRVERLTDSLGDDEYPVWSPVIDMPWHSSAQLAASGLLTLSYPLVLGISWWRRRSDG